MSGDLEKVVEKLSNDTEMGEIDDDTLQDLFAWIDKIPFSRPKKSITRDFSDGVMVAELVKHFFPKLVELHNYAPANSTKQKMDNWFVLNRKVFRKMHFEVTEEVIRQISMCRPWVIEHVLLMLRSKLDRLKKPQRAQDSVPLHNQPAVSLNERPEADQYVDAGSAVKNQTSPVIHNTPSQLPQSNNSNINNPSRFLKQPSPNVYPNTGQTYNPVHVPPPVVGVAGPSTRQNKQLAPAGGDVVSRMLLEEKQQELLAKEETNQILMAKVRRLEHLVQLKDLRIEDLQNQLDKQRSGVRLNPHVRPGTLLNKR